MCCIHFHAKIAVIVKNPMQTKPVFACIMYEFYQLTMVSYDDSATCLELEEPLLIGQML